MISVFGSKVGPEELEEIRTTWKRSGWELAQDQSIRRGICPPSRADWPGTAGQRIERLYMAVKLLNLKPGTEVILPSFTWISCAHAVVLAGCVPSFAMLTSRLRMLRRKPSLPA